MPAVSERPPSILAQQRAAHQRANEIPQIDPRDHLPNTNQPYGTVGPNVAAGVGDSHVMYPQGGWHAEAWAGWPTTWDTPWYGRDWSGFGYGRHDPDGYLGRVSVVGTCVDLNTRQLASFPIYGVQGTTPVRLPSWADNPEPRVYSDWSDFMKAAVNSIQLTGDLVLVATARFANDMPARFVVANTDRTKISYGDNGTPRYLLGDDPIDARDVCHVRYQTIAGRADGVSPLEWVGRNLVSASSLERYGSDIARHGVWAVLKHPANLNDHQRDDAKRNFMAARASGPAAPAVVSGGWELETLNLSPKDMALLDLKVFDEQRIASAFGVPPFLIGLPQPGGMTYSNANGLFDYHWRATLRPLAQSIAGAMSRWALPRGTRIEFNRDEYVRPGLGERAMAYSTMANIEDDEGRPAMTVDEIRVGERLQPYEESPLGVEALVGAA